MLCVTQSTIEERGVFYAVRVLSVSRLDSVDDKMINEYGAVGGMRIGRGKEVMEYNLPQRHQKSYITLPGIEGDPPRYG
jgi:hypothetical protein